ncbi:MAG: bifunctional phosphoribosylaminoimidazolecarboxamide formyltransferase/IMP cyclohydrolase [Endomicrobiia bacterium]
MKNALISVYDKTNILEFASELQKLGIKIYSTGGTAKFLKDKNIDVEEISNYINFPEILAGRVKTLHPKIFGGILAERQNKSHLKDLKEYKIELFDIVVVNLYPFEETILETTDEEKIIENIDIGGVALIRAAAKNFKDVIVVVDNRDYNLVLEKIKSTKIDIEFKKYLATKAFFYTSRYDSIISNWFLEKNKLDIFNFEDITIGLKKINSLRYGENPHQKSALYKLPKYSNNYQTLIEAEKIQGKELSYNNYLDLDSALNIIKNFKNPACVIIKHNNPCGIAESTTILDAYKKALSCDPISAFGGIIALNREVDADTAKEIIKLFTECIVATGYTQLAKKTFSKKPDLRLLQICISSCLQQENELTQQIEFRQINGGFLLQTKDLILGDNNLKIVTTREPSQQELLSLIFAYKVAKYTKSNAIVLAKGTQTVGIGAAQMSRIDALKMAIFKMNQMEKQIIDEIKDLPLVLASDGFFPFRDVVDESAKIGVKAIIQPGGSIRDEESIKAANEHNIAMIFTSVRHFKH